MTKQPTEVREKYPDDHTIAFTLQLVADFAPEATNGSIHPLLRFMQQCITTAKQEGRREALSYCNNKEGVIKFTYEDMLSMQEREGAE